eukprot:UN12918
MNSINSISVHSSESIPVIDEVTNAEFEALPPRLFDNEPSTPKMLSSSPSNQINEVNETNETNECVEERASITSIE